MFFALTIICLTHNKLLLAVGTLLLSLLLTVKWIVAEIEDSIEDI